MVSADVPTRIGGVEVFVNELSNFLSNTGIDVTVIGRDYKDYVTKIDCKRIIGVRLIDYLPKILRFAHYADYIYQIKVCRRMPNEHFDIIHGGNDNCFFLSLFRKEAPLVVTFHGTLAGGYSQCHVRLKPYQYLLSTYPEKNIAHKCDATVACSKSVKNELVNFYGVNPRKIKVIYHGVDINKFRVQEREKARKKLGLPSKNKYGIWVGTNPRLKGLETAIKAVRRLHEVKLIVVGVTGESDEKVVYFGRVNDLAKRVLLYNSADFFIFPTFYEGFPLAPLEALACGLPIVISEECPTKEILEDGVQGFVVGERKPECYAEKIETLLNNDACYREISYNCRKLAERYSWENQGKEYLKIYEKLVQ
jgi:glycosyltransferase involved in cell wall biosynthesis